MKNLNFHAQKKKHLKFLRFHDFGQKIILCPSVVPLKNDQRLSIKKTVRFFLQFRWSELTAVQIFTLRREVQSPSNAQ